MRGSVFESGHWMSAKRPYRLPQHRNRGLEIVLVTRGELRWSVDEVQERVTAGSVFFTLPWQTHGGIEEDQPANELFFAVLGLAGEYARAPRGGTFAFHPRWAIPAAEAVRLSAIFLRSARHAYPATAALRWLMPEFVASLHAARKHADPTHETWLRGLAQATLAELGRIVGVASAAVRPAAGEQAEDAARRRVRKFLAGLPESCAEPWTLATMSAACGLGRTRFTELLLELTGDRPVDFLNRTRVARAQRLLRAGPTPAGGVTEVAFACGFNSSQYFATVFKAFTGSSPRDAASRGSRHRRGSPG